MTLGLTTIYAKCYWSAKLATSGFLSCSREERVSVRAKSSTLKKSDINFTDKTIRTRSKPELGFRTKDCEERTIPVNDALIEALEYVPTLRGSFLFARKDGKPDIHIDRIVKRVAKRAGVDVPTKPMHGFRVLYATSLCRAGVDIYTIQKLLGHADIETTMSYLRALKRTDPVLRKQVNAAAV